MSQSIDYTVTLKIEDISIMVTVPCSVKCIETIVEKKEVFLEEKLLNKK